MHIYGSNGNNENSKKRNYVKNKSNKKGKTKEGGDCFMIRIKKRKNKDMKQEKVSINKMRTVRGITLIALVITIIILLILAGVTIATLTGENGILTKATEAREQTELADEKEKIELSAGGALAKENGGEISQTSLEEELGKYFENGKYAVEPGTNEDGTEGYIVTITENDPNGRKYFIDKNGNVEDYIVREPEKPTEGTGTNFNMPYGVIEVEFLSGTSYNTTSIPNHPILKEGMTGIIYNEETGETTNVSNSNGTDWYSYVETTDSDMTDGGTTNGGNSHWANAKVTVDDVDSYFVWIPRYAYRIIYFDSQDSENAYRAGTLTEEDALANSKIVGYSDARGIVDTEGRTKEGVAVQTAIAVNDKYFKTHPVFDGDVNYGGWTEEDGTPTKLQGIWVAKYEASSVEGNSNSSTEDNVTTKHIKIQPGVSSWRYITIGNMFTNAQNYNKNLNSHLMKNSEWGAVAYLTESKYGRNGTEITINNNGATFYTGGGSGTAYVNNTNQSSTGNIYGIYDLSGNAYEYIAGYYNGNTSSNLTNGSFASQGGTSTKYATAYTEMIVSTAYKYGDATYETSGWNSDGAFFVNSNAPFFKRSGYYDSGADAGVFNFYNSNGGSVINDSFRVCLAVQ